MSKTKFYVTAAIPYVNADPHIGHALEFVQTDTIKRYQSLLGKDAKSTSGGDENALKNVQAAEEKGVPIQNFVDINTEKFRNLAIKLNAGFDFWEKGSSKEHYLSSQKLWNLCKGDIYKKRYQGLYCVGCETFYSKEELNQKGECHEHPGKKLKKVSEENYFFKLSKYEDKLLDLITRDELKVIPEKRKKETINFIKKGLQDISISRSNKRAKNWGVPVPDDPSQRLYVWFDALNTYQSAVGFGRDEKTYSLYWPADLHVIGKGILRFHSIYWPAFLLSAKLKLPKAVFVHDYFTVNGKKMSKTLGNVIDPADLIEKYGSDPLRYYFLAKFSPFTDGDFSEEKFIQVYNGDLANGLGNLIARVAKLAEISKLKNSKKNDNQALSKEIEKHLKNYRFDYALQVIWEKIAKLNQTIDKHKLWENPEKKSDILNEIIKDIKDISFFLKPFLPETAQKIQDQFKGPTIKSDKALFPRLKK